MSTFEERIAKAVTDKLNDGTVEELVSDAVEKYFLEGNVQIMESGYMDICLTMVIKTQDTFLSAV